MASKTPLTDGIRPGEALSLQQYEAMGGYQGLRKALLTLKPAEVTETVKASTLRGRGGAGFLAGQKWSFVPMGDDAPQPKYVVVNADEMEPGTFKDRVILEGNPHELIEGAIITSYAVQASVAYIFLRWEYQEAVAILTKAISEAGGAGYLGEDILSSGFSLDLHLHVSAGRYICGEESAQLNSLEGERPNPRNKPPFPAIVGLWAKPTVINNVETISCVPHIIQNGPEWFRSLSLTEDGGTKLYGVSGRVKNPGIWELPMGTTAREILEVHAGGMQDGLAFRGLLPGGASTDFIVQEHLDTPMDFQSLQAVGSRLGTGTMIVLDDKTCPVAMVLNLERFFAQESCGWCTPCWGGLQWIVQMLGALENGEGTHADLEMLERHAKWLGPGNTFCALAPGAVEPLQSALRHFRDDFERHIREKRCPWR